MRKDARKMAGGIAQTADVLVLGAGAVGVCAALALRREGLDVALLDRDDPGRGTSYGNAGVLNQGSILPLNNPDLLRALPALATGRAPGFDFRFWDVLRRPLWAFGFLSHCRSADTRRRAAALHALVSPSAELYSALLSTAGASERLRRDGWLKLYRKAAPDAASFEMRVMEEFGVRCDALTNADLLELEPALGGVERDRFGGALWVRDTASVDDPGAVVAELARLFVSESGRLYRGDATSALEQSEGWRVRMTDGRALDAKRVVAALGPWSRDWLGRLGLRVPMAFERGGHREFGAGPTALRRPVYDVAGGYVLAPMRGRWRLTCGVELAAQDAPRSPRQLDAAEARMREAVQVGSSTGAEDWLGARPTLPDSVPAIGPTRRPNLFLAIGHQHIGLMTAPATGALLADLLLGRPPSIDPAPYAPSRYGL